MIDKQWGVLRKTPHGDHYDVQVVPLWQWEDHSPGPEHSCICLPKVEKYPAGNVLVIHNEIKNC